MTEPADTKIQESIGHLFRRHAGQIVSVLSRIFGFQKLDLIEDAVQDAMITAMKKWPYGGVPENPQAWLTQVAKNRVLDQIRRETKLEPSNGLEISDASSDSIYFSAEIGEDQLRMIFACCHPSIAPDGRVALTLKIVGGFSVAEIARAFLVKQDAAAKMVTRAKQKLREEHVVLEIPGPSDIPPRLDAVIKVLYLMFNEGYAASAGDDFIRKDLCFEAIRLCELLCEHEITRSPKLHALAALFLFQGARFASRSDHAGELVLLEDQDRSQWG